MAELAQSLGLDPKLILSQIFAFLFTYYMLSRFLFRPIARMVDERNREIVDRMARARQHEAEMEEKRQDYERRIADIEREARDRIQQATREAHEAGAQIVAEARQAREALLSQAREEIVREKERALVEIRDRVDDLAVGGAERIIRHELNDERHRELVRHFMDEVEHVGSS